MEDQDWNESKDEEPEAEETVDDAEDDDVELHILKPPEY